MEEQRPKGSGDEAAEPASGERASAEEVERQAAVVGRSPIVQALLEWLDGLVMVLNERRQILVVSDGFLLELGVADASAVIGRRLGEALGCVYPASGPGGCGTSAGCRYCGMLQAVARSAEHLAPSSEEYRVTLASQTGEQTKKYGVRVAPLTVDGERFLLLLLQHPTTLPRYRDELGPAAAQEGGDWPASLSRYTRLRTLGSGGMGTVYLVSDLALRPFALKVVRVPPGASATLAASILQRFRQESEVGLALHHPNIVRTYEADTAAEGFYYFVSEYCPFGTTSALLQRFGPFPVDAALFWLLGAARGLDHAWTDRRIVHRDVKPDNLLIGDAFLLKIADFGIARRQASGVPHLTTPGMVIGSARYMAPEQAYRPEEVDNRSDLYSLGATFYHLLSGAPPFVGSSSVDLMMHHASSPLVPLALRRPDLPAALCAVIDRLLSKQQRDRPADAGQLVLLLLALAAELGLDPDHVPESAAAMAGDAPARGAAGADTLVARPGAQQGQTGATTRKEPLRSRRPSSPGEP